jgi:hypothetical protein
LRSCLTDSEESQAVGRTFLKRYLSRTENRDAQVGDKVAPEQIAAVGECGSAGGKRFAYLKNIKQPTLVVSGNHDLIGSWHENHADFVFEANSFLAN